MAFTSFFYFLAFLAVVICLYYAFPGKARWLVLLAASYAFYLISSPRTFLFFDFHHRDNLLRGKIYRKTEQRAQSIFKKNIKKSFQKTKKKALKAAVQKKKAQNGGNNIDRQFWRTRVVKYFSDIIESAASALGLGERFDLGILIPLGISFYTFQTAAYIIDIYRSKIDADDNIFKFALFVSFFSSDGAGTYSQIR